jgi:hypothetical protein
MKKTFLPLIAALFLAAGLAHAADEKKPDAAPAAKKELSSSQQRMVDCNKEATGKKGDERKAFMSQCMKAGKADKADAAAPKNRMKECNKEATGKKGDERKAFMSECLKKK